MKIVEQTHRGMSAHEAIEFIKRVEDVREAIETSVLEEQFGPLSAKISVFDDQVTYYVGAGDHIFVVVVTEEGENEYIVSCDYTEPECYAETNSDKEGLESSTFHVIYECVQYARANSGK